MDDEYKRAERIFGGDMRAAEKLAAMLNPETMFKVQEPPKPVASVIDLRKTYNIQTTNCGRGIFRSIDLVTFDPDPEATMHIEGWGSSPSDSLTHLLEQLAEAALEKL